MGQRKSGAGQKMEGGGGGRLERRQPNERSSEETPEDNRTTNWRGKLGGAWGGFNTRV